MYDDLEAIPSYEQRYKTLNNPTNSTNSLVPAPQQNSLKENQQYSINHFTDPILVNEDSDGSDNSDNVVSWKKQTKPAPGQGNATKMNIA